MPATALRTTTSHPTEGAAPSTTAPVDDLRPLLSRRTAQQAPVTAGVCSSRAPATLALSQSLAVSFTASQASHDDIPLRTDGTLAQRTSPVQLTHDDLDRRGLSIRQAWRQAAGNLAQASRQCGRITFWDRPASEFFGEPSDLPSTTSHPALGRGIQVASPGGLATSWLAHPRSFAILDGHLRYKLGAHQMVYLAPARGVLIGLPDVGQSTAYALAHRAWEIVSHEYSSRPDRLVNFPLVWANGFPREYLS